MVASLPRRARIALPGAGLCVVLLVITWYAAHYIGFVKHADVSILDGFLLLSRPRLDVVTQFIAELCDPGRYVFLAAIPVVVALGRLRPRLAAMIALVLVASNETTQLLKPVLAGPRDIVGYVYLGDSSWPSGHATAAMALALCAVIAAPARARGWVGALMAAFAVAVCYSFLELGWHYPSDVLGGFLVAAAWTLLGIAALSIYEQRRGVAERAPAPRSSDERPSLLRTLAPSLGTFAVAAFAVLLILLARPHPVLAYASAHHAFVLGAAGIGVLGLLLSSGLAVMLRRG